LLLCSSSSSRAHSDMQSVFAKLGVHKMLTFVPLEIAFISYWTTLVDLYTYIFFNVFGTAKDQFIVNDFHELSY
jgi:hypothetical protein